LAIRSFFHLLLRCTDDLWRQDNALSGSLLRHAVIILTGCSEHYELTPNTSGEIWALSNK